MVETLICDTHGNAEATYVCPHLLDTLKDGVPRGFHWFCDEDGEIQAFCSDCWDATDEEWEWILEQGPKLLCRRCLEGAAAINEDQMTAEED